jgi:hypothetical protein
MRCLGHRDREQPWRSRKQKLCSSGQGALSIRQVLFDDLASLYNFEGIDSGVGSNKPAYSLANYLSSVGYFYLFDLEKGKRKWYLCFVFLKHH